MKLISSLLAAVFVLGAGATVDARAQAFPSKAIRLINPYPAGGATDIVSRAIAQEMSKSLGQPVIVENKAGAAGNVGAEAVAKAPPDGYTILLSPVNLYAIAPVLYSKLNYDPLKDLTPVIALTSSSFVLAVHPSVKATSVKELVDLAKASPGKLTFASVGNGSMVHLLGEMFKQKGNIDLVHVPYRGSAPAVADLLGGQVNMTFDNVPTAIPHSKAGNLRLLAVTGPKRDPSLPEVPTMAEAGVPGYEGVTWFGLAAPAGTPQEVINKLNAAAAEGARSPAFVSRMRDLSFDIIGGSPGDMGALIKSSVDRWVPVVKASGAKID